jgi:4-hydroxy-4-methyl-2-oxoglutarate aldolase
VRGAIAILNDAAVRDSEELAELGLPVWTRWIRSRGAVKETVGELDVPVYVGGQVIRPDDLVLLDADGVTVIAAERAENILDAALAREAEERTKRAKLQAGQITYDLDGLRAVVEREGGSG